MNSALSVLLMQLLPALVEHIREKCSQQLSNTELSSSGVSIKTSPLGPPIDNYGSPTQRGLTTPLTFRWRGARREGTLDFSLLGFRTTRECALGFASADR